MSHGRTLSTVHSSLVRQVADAARVNHKLDFITLRSIDVNELANWCVSAIWPPCTFSEACQAILDGKCKILGIPVKVILVKE